ncbi:MAG: flagellar biosynthetic protein FliR [Pseudomonadota bacterium]
MTVSFLPELALSFMLVFARLGTMVMLIPAIGDQSVPVRMRLVFALGLAILFFPLASAYLTDLPTTASGIVFLFGLEMVVGFFIGLTSRIILASLQIAGSTIAFQMGLGFATSVDPTQGTQGALIGTFLSITGLTLIMVADLHYLFIAAIRDSYVLFQPGQVLPVEDASELGVRILAGAFAIGVQIAAPFIVFGLLFNLGLGILSRLMPQVQIFFLGIPAAILLGFVILFAVAGTVFGLFLMGVEDAIRPFIGISGG